jgi:hypothetical protein
MSAIPILASTDFTRTVNEITAETKISAVKVSQAGHSMRMPGQFAILSTAASSYVLHNPFLETCHYMANVSAVFIWLWAIQMQLGGQQATSIASSF